MERYRYTKEQRELLESLQTPFAVYQFIDRRVVTLILSDGFCRLFGYDDRAVAYRDMDRDMYKDTHPEDVARIADAAVRFATGGENYEVVYRTRIAGSEKYRIVHAFGCHVFEQGVRLAQIWYVDEGVWTEDGFEQKTALNTAFCEVFGRNNSLFSAHYDRLTGLPGMTYFFELAAAGKNAILAAGDQPVLLYLDFVGMRFFNQKFGFAEGDKLLQSFAKLLSDVFSCENCSHLGQDHFAVYTGRGQLEQVLAELFSACREINGGNSLPVRVGIYQSCKEDIPVSVACDKAKLACDALKGTYDSAFGYYDQKLSDAAIKRQYIIENFDRALKRREIKVYFQPIIRAVSGKVCDEEALARWIDPEKGLMPPCEFIPYLEEAGIIYKLDLYVLDRVLEKIRAWEKSGFDAIPQSINLSWSDFEECDIVEEIRRRVDAAGVDHRLITVEITESTIGKNFEFMKEQIARFRDLGFAVWMDDFGSGYSSLDVLQSMSFDLIKYDMSFMRKLDEGESGKIILTELMKMATALGVDTVCEGVETKKQMQFLLEIGCSKLQGNYYCKPIPLEQIIERYEKGTQIGYEDPRQSEYYETIGRVNLHDFTVAANGEEISFQNFFNALPMCVMEKCGEEARFVRTSKSFREFLRRFLPTQLPEGPVNTDIPVFRPDSTFMKHVKRCCETGVRAFFDETMPDGSVAHSFIRKIAGDPLTGTSAIVVAVLSISDRARKTL